MAEKTKKKGVAIIISVGGKSPKSPADTSTPDMKKYGANPMKKAWGLLKYSNVNAPMPDEQQKNKEAEEEAARIQAAHLEDSMLTYGTAQPPTPKRSQYPQHSPELYNALMSLQQPNDPTKAQPRG